MSRLLIVWRSLPDMSTLARTMRCACDETLMTRNCLQRTPVRVTPAGWRSLLDLCENARIKILEESSNAVIARDAEDVSGWCRDVASAFKMLYSAGALVFSAAP